MNYGRELCETDRGYDPSTSYRSRRPPGVPAVGMGSAGALDRSDRCGQETSGKSQRTIGSDEVGKGLCPKGGARRAPAGKSRHAAELAAPELAR